MEHDVHTAAGRFDGAQVADVALDDVQVRGVRRAELEVGATSRREIIEDADPVTLGEETAGDVRANEPAAAGDQEQRRHLSIVTEQRGASSKLGAVLLP